MDEIVIGALVLLVIVVTVLLITGKFGRLKIGVGKEGLNAEVEAAKPNHLQPGPAHTTNIKVGKIEGTNGDVHVGNKYGSRE